MSLYVVSDETLASIAEAIKNKSGKTERLTFPQEFISEIDKLISPASQNYFDGEYVIIPSIYEQNLETEGKLMKEDLLISKIPYYETSNLSGGYTAIIGE